MKTKRRFLDYSSSDRVVPVVLKELGRVYIWWRSSLIKRKINHWSHCNRLGKDCQNVSTVIGVLDEPDSAKPAQLSSRTGPPGYIWWRRFQPKKIYRLKEDQAFSLSLELGRRSKFARHLSADFLQSPSNLSAYLIIADNDAPSLLQRGWSGFCRYYFCSENALKRIVSRDSLSSIFIQFYEVISVLSYVRWCFALKVECHDIFSMNHLPPSPWK